MINFTKQTFWNEIENARLNSKSINDFEKYFNEKFLYWNFEQCYLFQEWYELYETAVIQYANNLIWSALYLINNGQGGNTYGFAGWLICQGKEAYFQVLKNADYLAKLSVKKNKCNYEGIRFLAIVNAKKKVKGKVKTSIETMHNNLILNEIFNKEISNAKNEIQYGNLNRNRNWTIEDMKTVLPELHNLIIKH